MTTTTTRDALTATDARLDRVNAALSAWDEYEANGLLPQTSVVLWNDPGLPAAA